jgi:hypothetical protein
MKAEVVQLDTSEHQRVQRLLGFDGALTPAEQALVNTHAASCTACAADRAWQDRLRAAPPAAGVAVDPEAALAHLLPRLPARTPRWMPWALAAQFLVIAGLGALLLQAPPAYRVLGSTAAPAAANLVVMFKPQATDARIRALLAHAGARVVDGPTAGGAWLLHVEAAHLAGSVRALRAAPEVGLAEPLQVAP